MGERQPIYSVRGVLAGRLAGHKTMPASSLIYGAPPLTLIHRRIGYFCSNQTAGEAKLYATNTDNVPTPLFRRSIVGV